MAYATRQQLEARYGAANVRKWAEMDNGGNATDIATRITDALDAASAEVEAMLRGGPYTLPLTTDPAVDPNIVRATCRLAADDLYMRRGVTDFDEDGNAIHRLSGERERSMDTLKNIKAGSLRIDSATTATTIPAVVAIETAHDEED